MYDKYHCWAAMQYREMYVRMLSLQVHALMWGQLTAALEGKDWNTSPPSDVDGIDWTITSQSESSHSMLC